MTAKAAPAFVALLLIAVVAAAVILLLDRVDPTPATPAAGEGAQVILARLTIADPATWKAAVAALARLGPDAVPVLVAGLGHEHRAVREGAAHALGDIGPAAAPAVEALIRAFDDEDDFVRWKAARALGRIGPAATRAVPVLEPAARNERETEVVRATAQRALEQIRSGG